ncbi:YhdH/YhfP family quinone oxidoreductase [Litoribrevibacter albus]|uniref:Oxidoreductase n=1 Tax=Litoribrevibacter albus TaxID=1473156 RepID=A0AA37SCC7_9GAMM|nr:YhdH/YhfP family quinone oxidoreductase [Litoribrevibacter albus]GLQ32258.1 oxidoreductase [Litoribrevibacter albus]
MDSNQVTSYQAFEVTEQDDGSFAQAIVTKDVPSLKEGHVLIKVEYSAINYKDALSSTGNKGVTREYPHVPGIDASGTVLSSSSDEFKAGQQVVVTGHDLGMNTDGGYGQVIHVPESWVHSLPEGFSTQDAAVLGTAGITASLCIDKLLMTGIGPESGPVLVTGATGGVGSIAVALLVDMGFEVYAVSGKADQHERLRALGVTEVFGREELSESNKRPLLKGRWAAAIDTVGGVPLENILKSLMPQGTAAICGLVSSPALAMTVFPFILRGINLVGIDSAEVSSAKKAAMWAFMQEHSSILQGYQDWVTPITLDQLPEYIDRILKGGAAGRTLVKVS